MEKVLELLIIFVLILCIIPLLVMWLWNGMLPDMFGFSEIGFWRAWGLTMLGNLLFSGMIRYRSSND